MEAILHGADAVYIGASSFGARAAAGNSTSDIAKLIEFAHTYNVRVYAALNTILYDNELRKAEKLIHDLYRINTDAIIIQDMGILQLDLPPIPLHASTQMDNRTIEKVQFLEKAGFSQVVLARELTLIQIQEIASQTHIPIEVFVHGALCVSYSGQCYISQAVAGRSANRGECAQMCRLPYDLVDAEGKVIRRNTHLLSLKDLSQYHQLEKLLEAGASSLKIEGRLKDMSYVKNVVSAYRQRLDKILEKHPEWVRTSSGKSSMDFIPNLPKSFNRGFTNYFSNGRQHDIASTHSPKSMGELIGTVKATDRNKILIHSKTIINNGDGLCFSDKNGLNGFRVNRAEGDWIFPAEMPKINIGTPVYRNHDQAFETKLTQKTADRKITATISIAETGTGFALQITDEDQNQYTLAVEHEKQIAQKPQKENIKTQLSKTGNTPFEISAVGIRFSQEWFIPSSLLGEWRKILVNRLLSTRRINYRQERKKIETTRHPFPQAQLSYLGNVSNEKSRIFYTQHQSQVLQPAFEQEKQYNVPLMFTKYCIKHAQGWCPKALPGKTPYKEPFYLINNGKRYRLSFDCKACEMQVSEVN